MRNQLLGGGALAAGLLLVLGLLFISGQGSAPAAHAQTPECPDNQDPVRCITIAKAVDDDADAPDFDFTFDATAFALGAAEEASFVLDDDGTHVVTEAETDGWTLGDIACSNSQGVTLVEDVEAGTLTITVTAADDEDASATCVFMNAADAEATATATQTATTTTTTTTATTTTTTAAESTATPTETTDSSAAANTPVVPTVVPFTPTPQPPASEVQSGTISPPATGSGGLK